jgi:hypothetical protein
LDGRIKKNIYIQLSSERVNYELLPLPSHLMFDVLIAYESATAESSFVLEGLMMHRPITFAGTDLSTLRSGK